MKEHMNEFELSSASELMQFNTQARIYHQNNRNFVEGETADEIADALAEHHDVCCEIEDCAKLDTEHRAQFIYVIKTIEEEGFYPHA
jgi:hypothetical protein